MDKQEAVQQLEQLLNQYVDQENQSNFVSVLEIAIFTKLHEENAARVVISFVNKSLETAQNRHKGLMLLNKILDQRSVPYSTDNLISWVNSCINCKEDILKFQVLSKIISLNNAQEFNKSVVPLVPKIINSCLAVKSNRLCSETSLEFLKILMFIYPGSCSPYKAKIETHLSKYLISQLPKSSIQKAASAFNSLQQVGGSGPDGSIHKTNWSTQFTKLCSTIHKLYHTFFINVTEFETGFLDEDYFELPLSEKDSSVLHTSASTLRNIVIFINCMLIGRFPVEKNITISHLINVIKRGLSVDAFSEVSTGEENQFAALLYMHQIDLLYLLRSLIACCKQSLVPFSFTITKLLTDCLQRSHKNYFKNKVEYKKAIYMVLCYWIKIAGNKLSNSFHDTLLMVMLPEIMPVKDTVKLCLTETKTAKGKKRRVHGSPQEPNTVESPTEQSVVNINEEVATEVLKTCHMFLENVVLRINEKTAKMLHQTIFENLLSLHGGSPLYPYSNKRCQTLLYELLIGVLSQPCFCKVPYINMAANIFTDGLNRPTSIAVISVCKKGLNLLEKLCQGTYPTLAINENYTSNTNKKRKRNEETDSQSERENHVNGEVNGIVPLMEIQTLNETESANVNMQEQMIEVIILDCNVSEGGDREITGAKQEILSQTSYGKQVDENVEEGNVSGIFEDRQEEVISNGEDSFIESVSAVIGNDSFLIRTSEDSQSDDDMLNSFQDIVVD